MSSVVSKIAIAIASGAAVASAWNFIAVPMLKQQDEEGVAATSPSADSDTRERTQVVSEEIISDKTGKYKSLLKKHLTRSIVKKLSKRKTFRGATLWDVISLGYICPDSRIGVVAADAECYVTFAELFDPIVSSLHYLNTDTGLFPASTVFTVRIVEENDDDVIALSSQLAADPLLQYTTLKCRRNVNGFPMISLMTEQEFVMVEQRIGHAIKRLCDRHFELTGEYFSFSSSNAVTYDSLLETSLAFEKGESEEIKAVNGYRFWPLGRGCFWSFDKKLGIYVNREDHLSIVSSSMDGNISELWNTLVHSIEILSEQLSFCRDRRLGYLTFSPNFVGSGFSASFRFKLPKDICLDLEVLKETCRNVDLDYELSPEHLLDFWSIRCLGIDEMELIKETYNNARKVLGVLAL